MPPSMELFLLACIILPITTAGSVLVTVFGALCINGSTQFCGIAGLDGGLAMIIIGPILLAGHVAVILYGTFRMCKHIV